MRIVLILAALLALGASASGAPDALGQGGPSVGIDVDITGNDDTHIGVIDNCAEIPQVGDTLTFDLVVQGIDPAVRIAGYQVDIDYDPAVIQINSVIAFDPAGSTPPNNVTIISRIPSGAGAGFVSLTEGPLPDTDGSFTAAVADGTGNPRPPDNHEDGEGVLARITVEAVGSGVSNLIIPGPSGGPDGVSDLIIIGGTGQFQGSPVPIDKVFNAAVSVDTPCTPPPPSTHSDAAGTPSDAETGTSGTPDAGQTTEPGTPGADTQADGAPGSGVGAQTPGSGTPVPGGTPVSGDEGGAGGEAPGAGETDGGGLSTGAWAGIIAGIAATVLAASGAGWLALRRRRAGGTPTSGGEAGSD